MSSAPGSRSNRRRRSSLPVDDLVSSYRSSFKRRNSSGCGSSSNVATYVDSGDCQCECRRCGALFWYAERVVKYSRKNLPVYTKCCKLGTVILQTPQSPPPVLAMLFGNRSFQDSIRAYNSLFAMTSFGASVDESVNDGRGPYTFKISGQVSHWIGSLCPDPNSPPRFLQLYIYDSANEVANRLDIYNSSGGHQLQPSIVSVLAEVLGSVNKYVRVFRTAAQIASDQRVMDFGVRLYQNIRDPRYGAPAADMLGGIIHGDDPAATAFDVVVFSRSGQPHRISKLHSAYMPLQYPLLFPYGDPGWAPELNRIGGDPDEPKTLTINMYYAYLCHDRRLIQSLIVKGGRLFQQFLVDAYVCIEECRLDYIRNHQNELRSDHIAGIYDALSRGESDGRSVSKRVLLPSTFVGGPRYMYSHYQDALAISRVYGNPQYFITFTCNVGWDEITRYMEANNVLSTNDRPDIVARVFRMKVIEFIAFLRNAKPFGDIIGYLYTIEFQKRGLPHCHTLIWVSESYCIKAPEDVDKYICAELPDPIAEKHLYDIITKTMIHGPCGVFALNAPCMRDGKCKKSFPKPFSSRTFFDKEGYVHYRRRDSASFLHSSGVEIHNGFVVPYDKQLCSRFNAHINVEYCWWNMMIKYLFKYISKGLERVTYTLHLNESSSSTPSVSSSASHSKSQADANIIDEVKTFQDGRFICPHEAIWRILSFPIHERHPSVQILAVHLENMQNATFCGGNNLENIVSSSKFGKTTLTRWLVSNQNDSSGRHLTYIEYPSSFRWISAKKEWKRRSNKSTPAVGRLIYIHPTSGELFYLRMLLSHQKGCRSYEDIRTVNGHVYASFRLACEALGLTGDDKEWLNAFKDASSWATSPQLRMLFCHILIFCEVSNPLELWEEACNKMGDDISYAFSSVSTSTSLPVEALKQQILLELESLLNGCTPSKSLKDFNLPLPASSAVSIFANRLLLEETSYDRESLRQQHLHMVSQLNHDQRVVYDRVCADFKQNKQTLLFVYGHGGTGKTFLWSTILAYFRSNGHIILAIAASGVASLLLPSGRTAHSRLNIPIDLTNSSVCNIKKRSHLSDLLKKTSVIIWDEANMNDRQCFECVDRTFRDILENDYTPFGGISILLGGDFRQTLPVKKKKTNDDIIAATLPNSPLWSFFSIYRLQINMRLRSNDMSYIHSSVVEGFASWLLNVGDGNIGTPDPESPRNISTVEIPSMLLLPPSDSNLQSLIEFVYGTQILSNPCANDLRERAIICPKNDTTTFVNMLVLGMAPGTPVTHYSNDSIIPHGRQTSDLDLLYPKEYLNQLNFSGMPLHKLVLKRHTPIMLLRNINPRLGLCNGTRLVVTQQLETIIEATIITGTCTGQRVYIPRIPLPHVDSEMPFTFIRKQFPVKVCYAMTINKSQGQSLKRVGIYLPGPVFIHGQLYVALSRSTSPSSVKLLLLDENGNPTNKTKNVVFKDFLRQIDTLEVHSDYHIYLYVLITYDMLITVLCGWCFWNFHLPTAQL